ncbi:MAG TPA: RNA polymerase subunit sigma-70, partial [Mycobacteriales bacterium]|nr:RNA polymerase subunit sigma-70 [Mycobacteriales bacterium]
MSGSTLDRARAGDEAAFHEITAPHVRELHLHCYRMLGSLVDAEDLLQETLIAAWRGLDGFLGRSSIRTWLYRIATNRCLNAIRDGRRHAPSEPIPPFDPPPPSRRSAVTWLQPYPDGWLREAADQAPGPAERYLARETVELAFVAALQLLPPRQTAALLLCDVLGFAIADAAGMLDTSPTAIKGALQRARASLDRADRDAVPRAAERPERELAQRFARAFAADDIPGVIELLTDDAWLAMPPAPHEYHGPAAIAEFLRASADSRAGQRLRLVPTRANAQPSFGCYFLDPDRLTVTATGLIVLTTVADGISVITRFLDGDLTEIFGL